MVFEKIREIIAEQTGKDVEEITLETNVKEDLDADSLIYSRSSMTSKMSLMYL